MILGQTISVSVDKNSTSRYPKLSDFVFPLKIGFVNQPDSVDNNKEVYLLGFSRDVVDDDSNNEIFEGKVTAIATAGERKKYVVSPLKMVFYTPEIEKSLNFFDNYMYTYNIRSLYEKSCGAVLYTTKGPQIYFLIIRNSAAGNAGFPKGHICYNETEIETAVREIYEETGLDVIVDSSFKSECEYMVDGEINKKGVYFLAWFDSKSMIKIRDDEISEYWVVPYTEAVQLLTHDSDKEVLQKAYDRIVDKYYTQYHSNF